MMDPYSHMYYNLDSVKRGDCKEYRKYIEHRVNKLEIQCKQLRVLNVTLIVCLVTMMCTFLCIKLYI